MLKISIVFIALGLIAKQIDAQTSCTPNPCGTGNTCYLQNGVAKCSCASSYVGSKCQLINPCNAKPCGTRGACFPVVSTGTNGVETATFYCQCYSGYSGLTCETTAGADPCASSPCLNSGVCTKAQNTNGYTCTCVGPYTGTNCGTYIDYCSGNKCQNNALCVPDPTNQAYTCDCKVGFYGPYCENKLNNCQVNVNGQLVSPCQNGATCLDLIDGYVCQCVGPYAGVNCETYVNPCNSNPCGSGAVCTPATTTLGYTCSCAVGYFGSPCIPDPCMSNPCRYQGSRCVPIQPGITGSCTCPTTTATYVCICPGSSPEYAGNC